MAPKSQIHIFTPIVLPIFPAIATNDNNRGPVILSERTLVKIEIDQHAHAALSPPRSQWYKHDKTGKRFRELFKGQTRTDNEIRGWKRGGRPYLSLPKSAQCEARQREKRGRERGKRTSGSPGRGTRRDVVQVDLWKVGGKRERGTLCVCVAGQPRFTVTGTNRWTNLT